MEEWVLWNGCVRLSFLIDGGDDRDDDDDDDDDGNHSGSVTAVMYLERL